MTSQRPTLRRGKTFFLPFLPFALLLGVSGCTVNQMMAKAGMPIATQEGTEEEWSANVKQSRRFVTFNESCGGRGSKTLVVTEPDGSTSEVSALTGGWWKVGTKAKTRESGRLACTVDTSGTAYKRGQNCTIPCQ